MKRSLLPYLCCPACHDGRLHAVPFLETSKEIIRGILRCRSCHSWYLIENRILELVLPNLNEERRTAFFQAYHPRFSKLRISPPPASKSDATSNAKKKQSAFFDSFSGHYVLETQTFWRAYYHHALMQFRQYLSPGSLFLDIGSGKGLSSLPLLSDGHTVIGIDISRAMIADAIRRADSLHHVTAHYFVADAENLPFKKGIFDACIGFGILHHVTSPDTTILEIASSLKKNGIYFGHENNKTFFRPLFDLLMKVFTLWEEEAGEHQLLSEEELRASCERAGMKLSVSTHVFLPPHLFNLLPYSWSYALMKTTDSFFQKIPYLSHQGGTLIFAAHKTASRGTR